MDATSLLVELYCQAYADGISVFSRYPVGELGAATIEMNGRYAVFIDDEQFGTAADELCALAHECGHVHTGATHAVASPYDLIERHEYRADRWAIHQLLPPRAPAKGAGQRRRMLATGRGAGSSPALHLQSHRSLPGRGPPAVIYL